MRPNDHLRRERQRRGWSQARVAELIGGDVGNVSRWERGFSSPSPHFRERLCQLFARDASALGFVGEDGSMPTGEGDETPPVETQGRAQPIPPSPPRADVYQERGDDRGTGARILACASYALWWPMGLLVALFYRTNRFVLFHALQSLCFFAPTHLAIFLCVSSASPLAAVAPARGIRMFFGILIAMIATTAWGTGIFHAARGRYYCLPIVGEYCARLATAQATAHISALPPPPERARSR